MAELPDGTRIRISAEVEGSILEAAIASARAEAYSQGWHAGACDVLDELTRARAVTSTGGKRTVTRLRRRLDLPDERPAWLGDTVPQTPTTEATPHG